MNELEKVEAKYCTSVGPSMYPTLKSGDGLRVDYNFVFSSLKTGDIIVFECPEKNIKIVHRILKKNKDGYITRGDNNNKYDSTVVTEKLFVGKVFAFKRGSKIIKAHGGRLGYLHHKLMIIRMYTFPIIKIYFKYIYKTIARLGLFYWVNGKIIKPKIIILDKNGIKQKNLIWNKKVIAYKSLKKDKWQIKFPYRFFINNKKLQ